MELELSTPALLFSAITLLMLAYTNRFLSLAALVWFALKPSLLADFSAGSLVAFLTAAGQLGKPIRLQTEALYMLDQYDVVLM